MTANIFLGYFSIWAKDVVVANYSILDLGAGFNGVSVSDLSIENIWLDAESIIAAYLHNIILFGCGFEHDDCPLFDYVVISKHYLEVLILLLADYGTSRVYDASLPEHNVAHDLVEPQIQQVVFLIHCMNKIDDLP